MPQLNPNPWLFIMLTSWLTFTLIMQPKLLTFTLPNTSPNKTTQTTKTTPWPWPWT
uniref:ATP synthase complex subunit 8 n=1 Tax=Bucco capensis TaxID=135168 RepID=A0A7G9TV73_9PICI|nr:ATP synthase F0 subunit 8 [Bucco capensis]QNN84266.1 ATP synthase F0 subunit 8 [Bucco capensis]